MYKIYDLINNTQSSLGSEALYCILRQINITTEFENHFTNILKDFSNNDEKRLNSQVALNQIGRFESNRAIRYILTEVKKEKNNLYKYILMRILPIIGIALIALGINPYGFMILSGSIVLNFMFTYSKNNVYENEYRKINYILNIISASKKISKFDISNKRILIDGLNKLKTLSRISILGKSSSGADVEVLMHLVNTVFMIPLISYEIAKKHIKENTDTLIAIWKEMGNIESAISVLSYKTLLGENNFTYPKFVEKHLINGTNVRHPLVENAIGNSVNADNVFIVSGSNASGKSTYVKSIAINAILSQTIFLAIADQFSLKKGTILTSMAIKDDVENGDSYFIAEIKSLKRLIEDVKKGNISYYFIDEILKGTNTIERIAASSSVISYLHENNSIAYIATHDIELTEIFKDKVENIHFKETIDKNNNIVFDYKLYNGPSQTKNAIKLLEVMNFPKTIVDESNKRVTDFIEKRIW